MSTLNQFFDSGEKIGEVISMFSNDLPTLVTSGGGYYLKNQYAADNQNGRFNKFAEFPKVQGYTFQNEHNASTVFALSTFDNPVCKVGSYYLSGKYRSTFTGAYETITLNTITTITSNLEMGGVYIGASTGGLNYSTDGVTFNYVEMLAGQPYKVIKNEHNTLCIAYRSYGITTGTAGHVYTSTNGTSWTQRTATIDSPVGNYFISIAWCSFMNAFIAVTENGAFSTTDGITYTRLCADFLSGTSSSDFYVACGVSSIVVSSPTRQGVYRSTNAVDWTFISVSSIGQIVYTNGVYYLHNAYGFYFSNDEGVTWTFRSLADATDKVGGLYTRGIVDGHTYSRHSANSAVELDTTLLTSNHVSFRAKAEPAEGYAYVRIA